MKRKQSDPAVETSKLSGSQKRNRSQNEETANLNKKPRQLTDKNNAVIVRHFSDVARDNLQAAFIDGNFSSPSTIHERGGEKLLRRIKLKNKSKSIGAVSTSDNKISFGMGKARMHIFQVDEAADEDDTKEVDDASY